MNEVIIPKEVMDKMRVQYPQPGVLRLAVKYYSANIPNRYWHDEWKPKLDLDILNQGLIIIFGKNKFNLRLVSYIIKNKISSIECVMHDFFDTMSALCTKYDEIDINSAMTHLEAYDLIAITGIKSGDLYNKYAERFLVLLENLLNSRISKKIILCFEDIPYQKIDTLYGADLLEFLEENEFTKIYESDFNV